MASNNPLFSWGISDPLEHWICQWQMHIICKSINTICKLIPKIYISSMTQEVVLPFKKEAWGENGPEILAHQRPNTGVNMYHSFTP